MPVHCITIYISQDVLLTFRTLSVFHILISAIGLAAFNFFVSPLKESNANLRDVYFSLIGEGVSVGGRDSPSPGPGSGPSDRCNFNFQVRYSIYRNQCCGFMTFWCGSMPWTNGSEFGSGSCNFRHWRQRKTNFKKSLLITFWRYLVVPDNKRPSRTLFFHNV